MQPWRYEQISDYTKITDFTTKDTNQDLIEGVDFDNEFTEVSTMSTTKADKAVPADPNSVAELNSAGNLADTGVLTSDLTEAINSQIQPGMLADYAGSTAPSGYLLCDGTSYPTASYPDLFAVTGYAFGGSGANFNVPDLRGRVSAAPDNMGGTAAGRLTDPQADILGGSLGVETHTLTVDEMPSHDHDGGDHTHEAKTVTQLEVVGGGAFSTQGPNGTKEATDPSGAIITAEGGDQPHANVQPTYILTKIIKT